VVDSGTSYHDVTSEVENNTGPVALPVGMYYLQSYHLSMNQSMDHNQ
jgi:hypothetical protein